MYQRVLWVLGQVLVVLAAVAGYFGVRGLTEGQPEQAVRNAQRLMEVQYAFGIAWEVPLQRMVIDSDAATTVFNWIYIYGHWPVIAVVLLWLAIRHRAVFRRVRNAILVSGAVGLVIFASLPVAPPRLAGMGLVDTVTERSAAYRVLQPPAFTNQYAALPSLHVGWNLLIGLAIITATGSLLLRAVGMLMPLAMDAAVVLTANHYILDVLAGAALAGGAWLLVSWRAARAGPGPALRAAPPGAEPARPAPVAVS